MWLDIAITGTHEIIFSVFYLAGEFARHLQRQAQEDFPSKQETLFTNGEVICAQIAGLCHDLGEFCTLKAFITLVNTIVMIYYYRTWPFLSPF
jgi:hypothetical protein